MNQICRFQFCQHVGRDVVEAQLAQSVTVAECLFGRARVRLNVGYLFSHDGQSLVLDTSFEIGEYVAELFTGLIIRRVGEDAFSVEREHKVVPKTGT